MVVRVGGYNFPNFRNVTMYRLLAMDSVNLVLIEWPLWRETREIYDGEKFYGQARILFPFIWFNHIPEYNSFSSRLTSVLLLQTWFDLVSILADNRNLTTDATQNKKLLPKCRFFSCGYSGYQKKKSYDGTLGSKNLYRIPSLNKNFSKKILFENRKFETNFSLIELLKFMLK